VDLLNPFVRIFSLFDHGFQCLCLSSAIKYALIQACCQTSNTPQATSPACIIILHNTVSYASLSADQYALLISTTETFHCPVGNCIVRSAYCRQDI